MLCSEESIKFGFLPGVWVERGRKEKMPAAKKEVEWKGKDK